MPNASSSPKTPPDAPTVGIGGSFMLPITTSCATAAPTTQTR